MKKTLTILSAFVLLTAFTAWTGFWRNDDAHSQLTITVKHLGITDVTGTVNDFDVSIQSKKADFSDAVVELTAKVASIDTGVEARDNHLKSADFFDAEKYPDLHFRSSAIRKLTPTKFQLTGPLTMHDVTKTVSVILDHTGTVENAANKKQTAGFRVTGVIKRSDFNIGNGFPPPMISDEVRIKADGEFSQ